MTSIELSQASLVQTTFVHPEYQYWLDSWRTIRDCLMGEVEMKNKSERYLPKLIGMEPHEYADYLDRAVFYNMTARTVTGLLGTLFRRNPTVTGLPAKLNTANISKENQTLMQFKKLAARELISIGRYGVLVDMDREGKRPPYLAGYVAENIVDWTKVEIEGRQVVTEVVLRELRLDRLLTDTRPNATVSPINTRSRKPRASETFNLNSNGSSGSTRAGRRWVASYRVLRLEEDPDEPGQRIYRQYYHSNPNGDATPEGTTPIVFTPNWRGKPFRYIPFEFFGPYDNTPEADKSPILDIVSLNVSHYRSYAHLEHGRFYTALPVYYCPVPPGQEKGSYIIGPSAVWEVEPGQKPGIIEFNGQGLKFVQDACDKKEDQIAALGGRMLGVERVSAGQSTNMLKTKEANEQSLLLNIANVLDVGFTALLRWWAMWQDVSPSAAAKITVETNKDFLSSSMGAREFRAIQMMYENGIIPIDVVYDYLRKAEVIPDWMSVDEFKKLLDSPNSFPNVADVLARQRGAPDADTEWEHEHVLTNPDVVAVRGYDSQAPAGQVPLPGQTQGGAVTAAETMPAGLGAAPPPPPSTSSTSVGADGKRTTTVSKPAVVPKAKAAPKGPVAGAHPRSTVKTHRVDTANGSTASEVGGGGSPGTPHK